nr:peroxidase 43-like [Tanacetum cinerariifolium]
MMNREPKPPIILPSFACLQNTLERLFDDVVMRIFYWIRYRSAHTIGTTACFFMNTRLYDFASSGGPDPSINPSFLPELTSACPKGGNANDRLPMDHGSGEIFDKQILQNIRSGFAVLQSDAKLMDDPTTKEIVDSYFSLFSPLTGPSFEGDFVNSMVRMGRIGVKTGSSGNIRRVCKAFN